MITLPPSIPPSVAMHALAALRCEVPHDQEPKALIVVDMAEKNTASRLWIVDLRDRKNPVLILRAKVAHGEGSDPRRTGYARTFSNVQDSGQTSLGAAVVAERYIGHDDMPRYRLDGLQSTDFNMRARDVVFHSAGYVTADSVGWSQGCLAVAPSTMAAVDHAFHGHLTGSLVWVDAPGAQVPTCAPRSAWRVVQDADACVGFAPSPWRAPAKACVAA